MLKQSFVGRMHFLSLIIATSIWSRTSRSVQRWHTRVGCNDLGERLWRSG